MAGVTSTFIGLAYLDVLTERVGRPKLVSRRHSKIKCLDCAVSTIVYSTIIAYDTDEAANIAADNDRGFAQPEEDPGQASPPETVAGVMLSGSNLTLDVRV